MRTMVALAVVAAAVAGLIGRGAVAGPEPGITRLSLGIFDGTINERKTLKTTYMRAGAHWGVVEPVPGGGYDWSGPDSQIVPASNNNIQVMFAIRAISHWGSNCGPYALSGPKPEYLDEFKAWVQAAAERYDGDGGPEDAPGLGPTPVNLWQVENQWVTAVFYRGSDNCPAPSPPDAESILGIPTAATPPKTTGDPIVAAKEYIKEYRAVVEAVHAADPDALVGPGNIPTQTADAALFCEGKLGDKFVQNVLRADGTVAKTRLWTKQDVCDPDPGGPNPNNIKTWVRYWNVVLNYVMPRIRSVTDYLDVAQYGRYQDVELRNKWAFAKAKKWRFAEPPQVVAWEAGGPDRRVTLPGPDPARDMANDVPKRLALYFGTGGDSMAWFHNHFEPKAAVGVRHTSLLGEDGKKTPGYWNYRLFAEKTFGATSATLRRVGATRPGEGAYIVTFELPDGHRAIVAWADAGRQVTVDVQNSSVKVVTFAGKKFPPTKTRSTPAGTLGLSLTGVPVLILD